MNEQLRYPCLYAFIYATHIENQTRKQKTKNLCNYMPNSVRGNDFKARRGNHKERHNGFC